MTMRAEQWSEIRWYVVPCRLFALVRVAAVRALEGATMICEDPSCGLLFIIEGGDE